MISPPSINNGGLFLFVCFFVIAHGLAHHPFFATKGTSTKSTPRNPARANNFAWHVNVARPDIPAITSSANAAGAWPKQTLSETRPERSRYLKLQLESCQNGELTSEWVEDGIKELAFNPTAQSRRTSQMKGASAGEPKSHIRSFKRQRCVALRQGQPSATSLSYPTFRWHF